MADRIEVHELDAGLVFFTEFRGALPAEEHLALGRGGGIEPIGYAGIACADHVVIKAVARESGLSGVEARRLVRKIEGLEPFGPDLEALVVRLGGARRDDYAWSSRSW